MAKVWVPGTTPVAVEDFNVLMLKWGGVGGCQLVVKSGGSPFIIECLDMGLALGTAWESTDAFKIS